MSLYTHKRQTLLLPSIRLLLVISFFALAPGPVRAQDAFAQLDANGQTVAMAINQMRAQSGLPPLAIHSLLNLAAQNHVTDMIANHNYSHTGIDGSNVRQRVQRTGYAASTWVSENWVSVSDPAMAIQWWMNSYVHRNNILNTNWHEVGIGAGHQASNGQYIFVAVFAAGESGNGVTVMPPEPEPLPIPAGGLQYQIQPGDTLLSIGLRYGVEWPLIAGANGLTEYSVLQIGQAIRIPGVEESVGGSIEQSVQAATADSAPVDGDTFIRHYTVQEGNTLAGIAAIYGLSWQELARENGLGEYSVLSVGEQLRIPGAVKKGDSPSSSDAADAEGSTQSVLAASNAPREHVVAPGDTIISIALRYNMDWQELMRTNGMTEESVLQLGQTIQLP